MIFNMIILFNWIIYTNLHKLKTAMFSSLGKSINNLNLEQYLVVI